MTIDAYILPISPPCRAVLMTARYLKIPVNIKLIDVNTPVHLLQEFFKMNPQHVVPTIDDNGFILWESRAIMAYLVNQYAPNSTLYPEDPQKRAIIDRVLNFDIGVLYKASFEFLRPQIVYGHPANPEKEKAFQVALTTLESLLKDSAYTAGDHITLADISIYAGLSFTDMKDYTLDAYPNICAWLQKIKAEIPGDREVNEEVIAQFKETLKTR